jgi:hypothetical protein
VMIYLRIYIKNKKGALQVKTGRKARLAKNPPPPSFRLLRSTLKKLKL